MLAKESLEGDEMIRFYRNFVQNILLILFWVKLRETSLPDVIQEIRDALPSRDHPPSPSDVNTDRFQSIWDALDNAELNGVSADILDEMLDLLAKQLTQREKGDDGTLIDSIVRILNLPYARSLIGGQTMTRLRDALLLPDELVKFVTVQQREASCTGCAHTFKSGELATILLEANGAGLRCTRCTCPTFVACHRCRENSVRTDKRLVNAITRSVVCEYHDETGKLIETEEAAVDMGSNPFEPGTIRPARTPAYPFADSVDNRSLGPAPPLVTRRSGRVGPPPVHSRPVAPPNWANYLFNTTVQQASFVTNTSTGASTGMEVGSTPEPVNPGRSLGRENDIELD
jgi:hypothetical protein